MIPGFVPSATVVRPLFFEFPSDSTTYSIDQQFMVGSAILVSPVLKEGEFQVMGLGVGTRGVGVAQGGGGGGNCQSGIGITLVKHMLQKWGTRSEL